MPQPMNQAQAQAIAPGRQPTAPYNGWDKLGPSTQKILGTRGYTRELFDAPSAVKAREAVGKYALNTDSFANNRMLDRTIPVVGPGAPAVARQAPMTAHKANIANIGSYTGSLMGAGMGGLTSLPLHSIGDAATRQASASARNGAFTAPPTTKLNKQGAAMDDKQMFKVAFLAKCVEDGLTLDEIHLRVKQAILEKRAEGGGLSWLNPLTPLNMAKDFTLVGLAGLGLTGAGSYYLGNKLIGPAAYQATKAPIPSKDDLLQEELVNEYDRQTDILKKQQELTKRRRERDRGISGVTRY